MNRKHQFFNHNKRKQLITHHTEPVPCDHTKPEPNFVLVCYPSGAGGKFLAAYLQTLCLPSPIHEKLKHTNILGHAENLNYITNNYHNFQELLIKFNVYWWAPGDNLKNISKNAHLINQFKQEFRLKPPQESNFCYVASCHADYYKELFGWIKNLKIINVVIDKSDIINLATNHVKKMKIFLKISDIEYYCRFILKKDNHESNYEENPTNITEKKLIEYVSKYFYNQYFSGVFDNYNPIDIPRMDISFKDIFNGSLRDESYAKIFSNFMGIEFDQYKWETFTKPLYQKYLAAQSLL